MTVQGLVRLLIAAAIFLYLAASVLVPVWVTITWPAPPDAPAVWLLFSAAYAGLLLGGFYAIRRFITWFVRKWPPPTVFRA